MAFLNNSGLDIFLEIPVEPASKMFRPLAKEPIPIWGHGFPTPETAVQIPGGKAELLRLRDYHFEPCVAIDKRGTGCACCSTIDPAWNLLGPKEQTNRKGQRVDFPKRPVYLMPVWSYADNAIKVLRGGNQVYEDMDKYDTEGRDIRACDWKVFKTGTKMTTKYFTSRQDSSTFAMSISDADIKQAMADALKEYMPTPPDKLPGRMAVMSVEEATKKFMESQRTAPIAGAPALPPGGFTGQAQLPAAPAQDLTSLQAQLAALQAQLLAATKPVAAPAPAPGGQSDIPFEHKAAAPVAAAAAVDPKGFVLDGGKYIGSTVGDVLDKDPEYLKFYRAYVKDPAVKAYIDSALNAKPPVPVQAPPPPVATTTDATPVVPDRQALVTEVRAMIDTFPDFKGRGLGDNLIPFLKGVLGRFDYTESNVQDLVRLKGALVARKVPTVSA